MVESVKPSFILLLLLCLISLGSSQTNTLRVELSATRSGADPGVTAAKALSSNLTKLVKNSRSRLGTLSKVPISFPLRVVFTQGGRPVRSRAGGRGEISLAFDATGTTSFPSSYQALLQAVFDATQSTLDANFGLPQQGGIVHVRNYDATIGDRDAIAGGYYVPDNGSGEAEIRFPIYQDSVGIKSEVAAVNFIHTLLLAYQGQTPYAYDAFEEGLVRAVTAQVARLNLVAGLDPVSIEGILTSDYEVGPFYDWYNQRALGGPTFIAPNLRSVPIPTGEYGGAYLLRYRMSGAAWAKVLTEYPTFAKALNNAVAAQPSLASNVSSLVSAAQTILTGLNPGAPTVEGLSFSDWFNRQWILDTNLSYGLKLILQPTPIVSSLANGDFGVFALEATYFSTDTSGNETLKPATSYPILWDTDGFNRISTAAQDDVINISSGYGSIAPNLPDFNAGVPYRFTVDLPVQDQLARVELPAGAIATATNPIENDFYGTVTGITPGTGQTLVVRLAAGAAPVDIPVKNGAFGTLIGTSPYLIARTIEVKVVLNPGLTESVLLDRIVDKAKGSLALSLNVGAELTQNLTFSSGLNAIGLSVDPFGTNLSSTLGVSSANLLVARYDPSLGKYDLNPSVEPLKIGNGYFVRVPSSSTVGVTGRAYVGIQRSIALRPGWNLISNPLPEAVTTSQITVVHTTESPALYSAASGVTIGNTIFGFVPGANDPASGVPETGSFVGLTSSATLTPGASYYIRCLASEGATLLFSPATVRTSRALNAGVVPSAAKWSMHLGLYGAAGDRADCYVGMASSVRSAFDPKWNSGPPPSMGGLSLTSTNGATLYKDYRSVSSQQIYSLNAQNLQVGKTYTLVLGHDIGVARKLYLSNLQDRTTTSVKSDQRYRFIARSTSISLNLTVLGVN